VLSEIEKEEAVAVAQDEAAATYAPPLRPQERAIAWGETAVEIDRRVRAFAPRPGAFAILPEEMGGGRIKILAVEPEEASDGDGARAPGEVLVASDREGLIVAAGRGRVRLVTVQAEGKRPMDAAAFLRGHAARAGVLLRDGVPARAG
jgi:methionyl-tRNA formyltransferase